MLSTVQSFLKLESAGGILLMVSAALAMLLANSSLAPLYNGLNDLPVAIQVGSFSIAKPLLLWINDGLMAVFFFLVGLELKRELYEGELNGWDRISLPLLGAAGGMLGPAAIYVALNYQDPVALGGWAIPAATDIAFALGILTLLGRRVPVALKVFLVSLAIFDDLGAIVIIALFYTTNLSLQALAIAAAGLAAAFALNRLRVMEFGPYLVVGIVIWTALLKSGVHATLAGVLVAMSIPLRDPRDPSHSPLRQLEHDLHGAVAFIILPVFAFANAGVSLTNINAGTLTHGIPLGIALGLFIGKQVGVFGLCWLGVKLGLARLPRDVDWFSLYGVALLCGVGFTMSLFIGSLAFEENSAMPLVDERIGIIAGSLVSAIAGYLVLYRGLPRAR
ncbi:MAG: Na+/H+ antiporter NhaA [Gammaproteobacteria bacterium]|jgi:NhaA family Na+:H+ antiporter|nr:Na+/H+ antiporter NhaA [Gammaproteobacteria bacterium]